MNEQQIDTLLRVVGDTLHGLSAAERRWADVRFPADEREDELVAFHAEWDVKITRLEQLAAAYESGAFSVEQAAHFRALIALLEERLPDLRRLHMRVPSAALLRRLRAARVTEAASAS